MKGYEWKGSYHRLGMDTLHPVSYTHLLGGDAAKSALEGILTNKSEDGAIRALAFKSLRRVERRLRS